MRYLNKWNSGGNKIKKKWVEQAVQTNNGWLRGGHGAGGGAAAAGHGSHARLLLRRRQQQQQRRRQRQRRGLWRDGVPDPGAGPAEADHGQAHPAHRRLHREDDANLVEREGGRGKRKVQESSTELDLQTIDILRIWLADFCPLSISVSALHAKENFFFFSWHPDSINQVRKKKKLSLKKTLVSDVHHGRVRQPVRLLRDPPHPRHEVRHQLLPLLAGRRRPTHSILRWDESPTNNDPLISFN